MEVSKAAKLVANTCDMEYPIFLFDREEHCLPVTLSYHPNMRLDHCHTTHLSDTKIRIEID